MLSSPSDDTRRGNLSEGKARKPFLFGSFLLRRAPIILLIGGGLTVLFLLLLLPFLKSTYATDGILLFDPTKQITVAGREQDAFPGAIRDYMRTMVQRINTMDVLVITVKQLKRAEYPAFFNPLDPPEANAARLMKRIKVKEVPMTNLIAISIETDNPAGLAPTLNRLMQVFVEKNQLEKRHMVERRINYLTQEREKIITRLQDFKEKWRQTIDTLPHNLFIDPNYTAHMAKLELSRKQYLEAQSKSEELHQKYLQALANRESLSRLNMQALANEKVADNFGINRMELWTYEQSADLRRTIDGLTQENTDRRNVEDRLKAMEDYLVNYKAKTAADINKQLKDKQRYELDLEVARAKSAADAAAAHLKALAEIEKNSLTEHNEIARGIFDLVDIQFNTEQLRDRLKTLNTRIDDAEVEAMAPVQIFVDKVARDPTEPVGSNLKVLAIVSLLLGLGSVGSFILAFDMVDNRLRDPKEVESALGGSAPEPIPLMEGLDHPPGSFVDVTFDWPRHPASMAIRTLGARLDLEREKHDAHLIALSGLDAGCGVSSLSLALAHVLKTHDRRVLVIECNLLRPGLARVHGGLEEGPGLWAWLAAEVSDLDNLVQRDPRRQIDVITAGGLRASLPDRSAFLRLLETVRERYDLIVLDTANVLEDEFSLYVAAHADAVLLVGREDISLYADLRRAIDRLIAAQIPALSALLNFTRTKRSERIRTTLHSEMRWLSKKHWILHGMTRRSLRRLTGQGPSVRRDPAGTITKRRAGPRWLAGWLDKLAGRAKPAPAPAHADERPDIGPLPFMDGEIILPGAEMETAGQACKWIYDKKRKVLVNLSRKMKYPEGTYIYQCFGDENGFEIPGAEDSWVFERDVTFINGEKSSS